MKNAVLFLFVLLFSSTIIANGVGVVDASNGTYLQLISSNISVEVENQVAVITSEQTFKNNLSGTVNFKYAFPMPEGASATELQLYINGIWRTAQITAQEPDTTLPGGGTIDPNLKEYLGTLPLYFSIDDQLEPDSITVFRLTYVELLKYKFGNVLFDCPNDYTLIQNSPLMLQQFDFYLTSTRTIENIQLLSHSSTSIFNDGSFAQVNFIVEAEPADANYRLNYSLNSEELGLFSFSTYQPDSLVPDEHGNGFFTFVAEPDPSEVSDVINKVFTLIIDRSGSMGGNKIVQARNAARFIINNLNDGDQFNIVDFSSSITSFSNEHLPYNLYNRDAALNYISSINAGGGTNISGAFGTAVPQFSTANDSTANIIVFFTDGQATAGITNTQGILDHVSNLINQNESEIMIFNFGIGSYANEQLLTLLANENNGLAEFLRDEELEEVITQFYLLIRNPVLLGTEISFSSGNISEIYPTSLPSLYKGQQMIVSGRYNIPENVNLTLSGEAFGQPVQYNYTLALADSSIPDYQFLPKIWAKQKIETLMVEYFSYPEGTFQSDSLKEYIQTISVQYGVITQFTSFTGFVTGIEEEVENKQQLIADGFKLLGNYPNPFNPSTQIKFSVSKDFHDVVKIKIFNSIGELVRVLTIRINGQGVYEITWDGLTQYGEIAPSDMYIYSIDFGNTMLAGKMILMK